MKTLKRIILIPLLTWILPAAGQQSGAAPISHEEFRQWAENPANMDERQAMLDQAFAAQRLDLVRICFHGLGGIIDKMEKTPPSVFRDDVLLLLLEEKWLEDSPRAMKSPGPLLWFLVEELATRLPEEKLVMQNRETYTRLAERSSRLELAARFRALLERERGLAPGTLQPPPPDPVAEAAEETARGAAQKAAYPPPPRRTPVSFPDPPSALTLLQPFITGTAAAAVLAVTLYMIIRKRKKLASR